ncbi:MAG: hypothetical protein II738_01055 [Clostridia bacterium]|nr:hypothetical protein [Clostridia bacterium]
MSDAAAMARPFVRGYLALLLCGLCYLLWWLIAYRPVNGGKPKGMRSRSWWLLFPAVAAGLYAVWSVVGGSYAVDMAYGSTANLKVGLIGLAVFVALFFGTWFGLKRPVTTELILIPGWATMTVIACGALHTAGVFTSAARLGWSAVTLIAAAIAFGGYLVYYKLEPKKAYLDGAVPLVLLSLHAAAFAVFTALT